MKTRGADRDARLQFWVYILRCADGSFYTGHTDNLEARLWQHEQGICCDWTRKRRPVELAWADTAPTRRDALEFEMRVKRWSRAKKIALIESDWAALSYHAKKPRERPSFTLGTNVGLVQDLTTTESSTPFLPSENEGRSPQLPDSSQP